MANTRRPIVLDPAATPVAARVALALARFFVVAPLYPVDHTRSHGVAEQCLAELRATAAPGEAVRIEIARLGFQVQGAPVALEHPQVQRLHQDLSALGIARVEIGDAAMPADLHRFVNVLVEARRRVGSTQGLRQLELSDLPDPVRIVQREFGRRGGEASSAATVQAAVERVLDACEGVEPETQALLGRAVERLFGDVVETLCDGRLARAPGQPFGRSLDEVLELGVQALRDAMEELTSSGGDPADIQGLFGAAEKALAIAHDRDSVEVMLSVLRESASELRKSAEPARSDTSAYTLSLDELRREIEAYGSGGPPLGTPGPVDRREELTIIFHVLLSAPPDAVRIGAEERLAACLARPLDDAERGFLESAMRGLASRGSPAGLDAVLPPTLRVLRTGGGAGSVLASLSASASPGQRDALWPHLVNELLVGGVDADAVARRALLERVRSSGDGAREGRLERLLALEAVRTQRFAPALFDPPPPELFPVFGALVARQVPELANALLAGLQRHLPPWPGAEALLTFDSVTPACRALLIAALHEGAVPRASVAVEQQARRTLASALRGLRRADVSVGWAPRAITALGALATAAERPLLREIGRGFRLWPWRRWPAPCREAANAALRAVSPASREASGG